jgi:hypothetical protein
MVSALRLSSRRRKEELNGSIFWHAAGEHHVLLLQSQGAKSSDSPWRTARFDEQDAYER